MRRFLVPVAAAAVALSFLPGRATATDIRNAPLQLTAKVLPRAVTFGEPSLAIAPNDHLFICGPYGIPGGRNGMVRSADWETFTQIDIIDRAGGGDCDVRTGPDGAIYTANLQAAASAVRKSVDDGRTWTYQSTEDAVEQDRQWLATDPVDGSIVYMGYHDWSIGAIIVAKSLDGGKTFPIHSVASTDPVLLATSGRSTYPGPVRVDPSNHNRLYMVWTQANPADCTQDPTVCTINHTTLVVSRSEDGGLTWTPRAVLSAPFGSSLSFLIPWLSIDRAGNVYAVAGGHLPNAGGTQRNGMFLFSSTTRGDTWSAPVTVNSSPGAVVFPTVVAGRDGAVDLSWAQSSATSTDDKAGVWSVHFAQSINAHDAAPTFAEVVGPVIHKGDVCVKGLLCTAGGDRTLLDFMDLQIDSFGYAHMAVSSTVPRQQVLYWRQDAGPSLLSDGCAYEGDATCVTVRPRPKP